MSVVTIIGAGMMGSALAFPARENGNIVRLVGTPLDREIIDNCRKNNQHLKFDRPFPDGIEFYQIEEFRTALENSDLLICGVSSFGVEYFAEEILPFIPDDLPVLSVTKGLICEADGTLISYPAYWQRTLDKLGKNNKLCAIGGPCTSYELVAHDNTIVAFCGEDIETLERLKKIMATNYYHITVTTDVIGIESAVALKNGYALAIALTIGENFSKNNDNELHFNSQAAIFLQSSKEMRKLITMLGGNEDSFYIGIGDLYVTVYGGRTRKVGILLGEGFNIDEALEQLKGVTLESLVVAKRVAQSLRIQAEQKKISLDDFPMLLHVDDIISKKQPLNIPWEKFV